MLAWQALSNLQHRLRQWRKLAPWERWVLTNLAWRLCVVWVLVRLSDFKKTRIFAERDIRPSSAGRIPTDLSSAKYAQRCGQLVEIAARHGIYQANCLHRSLALCSFLRHRGLQAHLRIGVLPKSKPLQAHAWVELSGVSLGTQPIHSYQPFEQLAPLAESLHFPRLNQ